LHNSVFKKFHSYLWNNGSDLRENFITDVSLDVDGPVKLRNSSASVIRVRNVTHSFSCFTCPISFGRVFTALREMQTRSSDDNSVCMSVCQTRAKTEERSVQIFIPYERSFNLVF